MTNKNIVKFNTKNPKFWRAQKAKRRRKRTKKRSTKSYDLTLPFKKLEQRDDKYLIINDGSKEITFRKRESSGSSFKESLDPKSILQTRNQMKSTKRRKDGIIKRNNKKKRLFNRNRRRGRCRRKCGVKTDRCIRSLRKRNWFTKFYISQYSEFYFDWCA